VDTGICSCEQVPVNKCLRTRVYGREHVFTEENTCLRKDKAFYCQTLKNIFEDFGHGFDLSVSMIYYFSLRYAHISDNPV